MEIFRVENLTFKYPDSQKNALENVSFNVNKGEFLLLCGKSGCGKTTLLRLLKPELSPHGEKSGVVFVCGQNLFDKSSASFADKIGFVSQTPENQIVTENAYNELAFGLENLGALPCEIKRRIAEMSSFFGIDEWIFKDTSQLSGGQKQILSLASVMVMSPDVIILDEPSAQLDPIATDNLFATLRRLNERFGITVIISEHNLGESIPIADRVIYLDGGKLGFCEPPRKACIKLFETQMRDALPSASRIFGKFSDANNLPLTVKEGREIATTKFNQNVAPIKKYENENESVIKLSDVFFRYEKNSPDVLKGVDLEVKKGCFLAVLGSNGTGKTTLLNVIAGLNKAYHGNVKILNKNINDYKGNSLYRGKIALLPQNPRTIFSHNTVRADYVESCKAYGYGKEKSEQLIENLTLWSGISELLERHPSDLSGGEIQKSALVKILLSEPEIILLDEPTKGIDSLSKSQTGSILRELCKEGKTVFAVTHDVDFAAEFADECALLFDGQIVSRDVPQRFFAENQYYTTEACAIARGTVKNAVTVAQVTENLKEK